MLHEKKNPGVTNLSLGSRIIQELLELTLLELTVNSSGAGTPRTYL